MSLLNEAGIGLHQITINFVLYSAHLNFWAKTPEEVPKRVWAYGKRIDLTTSEVSVREHRKYECL